MQVLLSSECSAPAQGTAKGRWTWLPCNAPDLSVLALCPLLRGPETAHVWSQAELGPNPSSTASSWVIAQLP